jgi:hypothetical protein
MNPMASKAGAVLIFSRNTALGFGEAGATLRVQWWLGAFIASRPCQAYNKVDVYRFRSTARPTKLREYLVVARRHDSQ